MTTFSLALLDSMDALEAVRPSMFADITVSDIVRLWLFCRHCMVLSCLMCWNNSQII